MKSGRRYVRKDFVAVALAVCFMCCGCGNGQEEALADTVIGGDAETGGGSEDTAEESVNGTEAGGSTEDASVSGSEAEGAEDKDAETIENGVSGNALASGGEEGGAAAAEGAEGAETPRREPVKVKGIYVSGPVAGIARMDELIELVDQTELNAVVIDIKNDEGKVTYDMQSEQVLEIGASVNYISDIEALVTKCKEKNIYLIARIVAFRDPYLAERKPEWAVHTKEGAVFRDKSGLAWVNPYERGVWDYLVEIASEAAAVGFDEVQFDYIRFSTDVKADEVDYGPEAETVGKIDIITEFTQYIYEKLRPLGVYVAADVFGTVIENETDQQIVGQDYVKMAEYLDYICPMIYPSHYRNGSYGIAVPDADPYHTIYGACSASVQELGALPEENRAHVRAWLQSFTASWVPGHISYGPQQIRAQIKGAYDAGYDEWILWNAAVKYQRDSLLTDEEAEAERQQWETEKETKKQEAAAEETAGEQGEATQEETAGQQGEATQEETAGQQEQVPQEETPQDKTAGTVPEGIAGQPTDTDPDASTGQQAVTAQ